MCIVIALTHNCILAIDSSALASASIDSPALTTDTAIAEESTRHRDYNSNISGSLDISQSSSIVCSQTRYEISNQDKLSASKNLDDILKAVLEPLS